MSNVILTLLQFSFCDLLNGLLVFHSTISATIEKNLVKSANQCAGWGWIPYRPPAYHQSAQSVMNDLRRGSNDLRRSIECAKIRKRMQDYINVHANTHVNAVAILTYIV